MSRPTVAVLRPDDNRIAEAVEYLQSLDVSPIPDADNGAARHNRTD